jgi:glycosyltransferase involved in cell wall biosynthesis
VRAASRLAAETGAEAILATQPNSLLLAGTFLASRLGLPLVSDFRDVWTTLVPGRGPVRFREVLERPMEARVLQNSAAVLCNTPRMLEGFGLRVPEARPALRLLPNGYDPADFPAEAPCNTGSNPPPAAADRPLEVAYAGAFYGDYNPLAFLRGLGRAVREGLVPPGGVRARFYGAHDRAVATAMDAVAREEGVADLVARPGLLSHADAVKALLEADLLLLVIPPGPEAACRITAKSYEILAAGRPVLAMVPPGDARDLVEASGAALAVVESGDATGAARALGQACSRLQEGTLGVETRWDVVRRYDRRAQAAKLARILDEVTGRPS